MLSMWSTYFIMPSVFLGGVFNPISALPRAFQYLTAFNPMHYYVSGMRYSITGIEEIGVATSMLFSLLTAGAAFFLTVHLFRIGYKLRT